MTESNAVREFDLAVLNALQLRPRAEWGELAAPLGVTAATVARRWQSLRGRGLAWIAVAPGGGLPQTGRAAFVLVSCVANDQARLAQVLMRETAVATLDATMGHSHFLLDVLLPDLDSLRTYLSTQLPSMPGVIEVTSLLITSVYTGGTRWRVRALDADQTGKLSQPSTERPGEHPRYAVDDLDRSLIAELTLDGRLGLAQLATRCDTSAPTVRRRLDRLLATGTISLRCEMATPIAGPMVSVTFLVQVPTAQLDQVGELLAGLPTCRLAAAVTGRQNLLATMWLGAVREIRQVEMMLVRRVPELVILDRIVHTGTLKRIGHLLDEDYRTTAIVPLAAWGVAGTAPRNVPTAG